MARSLSEHPLQLHLLVWHEYYLSIDLPCHATVALRRTQQHVTPADSTYDYKSSSHAMLYSTVLFVTSTELGQHLKNIVLEQPSFFAVLNWITVCIVS